VAGWGELANDPTARPFTYNVNTQAFTQLGLASGGSSGQSIELSAVNSSGWLAGQGGVSVQTAYTWNGTSWTNVGTVTGGRNTYSNGIDDSGDVVGRAWNSANKKIAFYCQYNGGSWNTPIDLGLIPSTGNTAATAQGINDHGQIVGYDYEGSGPDTAFLAGTTSGSAVALSSLVPNLNGWTLEEAMAIDNAGDVVGLGVNALAASDAFLAVPWLPGDAVGDGKVDVNDLTIVLSHFGQTGQTWTTGDFVGDGTVDVNDLTILLSHFGDTAIPTAAGNLSAAPEPGTLLLLAAGIGGLLACAWRKRKWEFSTVAVG
jgi:hypothetical protein